MIYIYIYIYIYYIYILVYVFKRGHFRLQFRFFGQVHSKFSVSAQNFHFGASLQDCLPYLYAFIRHDGNLLGLCLLNHPYPNSTILAIHTVRTSRRIFISNPHLQRCNVTISACKLEAQHEHSPTMKQRLFNVLYINNLTHSSITFLVLVNTYVAIASN